MDAVIQVIPLCREHVRTNQAATGVTANNDTGITRNTKYTCAPRICVPAFRHMTQTKAHGMAGTPDGHSVYEKLLAMYRTEYSSARLQILFANAGASSAACAPLSSASAATWPARAGEHSASGHLRETPLRYLHLRTPSSSAWYRPPSTCSSSTARVGPRR